MACQFGIYLYGIYTITFKHKILQHQHQQDLTDKKMPPFWGGISNNHHNYRIRLNSIRLFSRLLSFESLGTNG